ncbi:hypothetical protein B0H13DRAFT_2311047 [Mycena leptocephala]|nr:hypothetical protein B0H13DRAFT_2311047 [Mycena leptocephala]
MAAGSAHSISFAIYSLRISHVSGLLPLLDVNEYDPLLGSSVAADMEEEDRNILFSASRPAGSAP